MHLARALVLTTPPGQRSLTPDLVAVAERVLGERHVFESRWLGETEAYEFQFVADSGEVLAPLLAALRTALAASPVDVNIVADDLAYRRKGLLVADMESTIIGQELVDELAEHVGLRDRIAAITERAMRGEIEFAPALRERVALLSGLDARILDEVYEGRVSLMPGAAELVATMRANGAHTALVSGGFTVFTHRVAARLGFDEHQANALEIADGRLTGRVREPILGREAKKAALERIAAGRGLDLAGTLAVGDGANDLEMIRCAGLGVAFRAKPQVEAEARAAANGAVIRHGDLTALLYLQGYRRDEFLN